MCVEIQLASVFVLFQRGLYQSFHGGLDLCNVDSYRVLQNPCNSVILTVSYGALTTELNFRIQKLLHFPVARILQAF